MDKWLHSGLLNQDAGGPVFLRPVARFSCCAPFFQAESFWRPSLASHVRRSASADAEYTKLHIMWLARSLVARLASKYPSDGAEPQCLSGGCRESNGKARHTGSWIRSPRTRAGSGKPVAYPQPADGRRACRCPCGR